VKRKIFLFQMTKLSQQKRLGEEEAEDVGESREGGGINIGDMSASAELTSSEHYSVKKAAAVAKVQELLGREFVMQNALGTVTWLQN